MNARKAALNRASNETNISLELNIDGTGVTDIATGIGLLDHQITLTAFWAAFDLRLKCRGDSHIDGHHSAEDVGLVLGQALLESLGDKAGMERVGSARVPMDEALADVSVDISGRAWLEWRGEDLLPPVMGGEERDLWREYYKALASAARMNLHISFIYGKNGHHLLESAAKGLGIALNQAVRRSGRLVRSTKGRLD